MMGEISNICISCYFLNPTHKQYVVTGLGWDYAFSGLIMVWLWLKIDVYWISEEEY